MVSFAYNTRVQPDVVYPNSLLISCQIGGICEVSSDIPKLGEIVI